MLFAKVQMLGVERVARALRARMKHITTQTNEGVRQAAEFILAESNARAPVVDYELIPSGHLEDHTSWLGTYSVAIVYDAPYALLVHENRNTGKRGHLNPPHGKQKYSYVGEWKFLEHAVKFNMTQIRDIIRGRSAA